MKSIYGIIFSIMTIIGMTMMGCGAGPGLPVSATDGDGSDITVDWTNYNVDVEGPYTVTRDTDPDMVDAADVPVAGCVNTMNTSCVDTDASAGTAYFYVVTGSGDPSPVEGGFHGTLTDENHPFDPLGAWGVEYKKAQATCPGFTGCVPTTCPGGSGTYAMSAATIPDSENFLITETLVACDTGDYVINSVQQGVISATGSGYMTGLQIYTDETGGGNSGEILTAVTIENLQGDLTAPSSSYKSSGSWDDAEYTDESP